MPSVVDVTPDSFSLYPSLYTSVWESAVSENERERKGVFTQANKFNWYDRCVMSDWMDVIRDHLLIFELPEKKCLVIGNQTLRRLGAS